LKLKKVLSRLVANVDYDKMMLTILIIDHKDNFHDLIIRRMHFIF